MSRRRVPFFTPKRRSDLELTSFPSSDLSHQNKPTSVQLRMSSSFSSPNSPPLRTISGLSKLEFARRSKGRKLESRRRHRSSRARSFSATREDEMCLRDSRWVYSSLFRQIEYLSTELTSSFDWHWQSPLPSKRVATESDFHSAPTNTCSPPSTTSTTDGSQNLKTHSLRDSGVAFDV